MAVQVVEQRTGKVTTGKFAKVDKDQVFLYTGIMQDKKGGWRGCGKRLVFSADLVTVSAEEPAKELQQA